MITVIALLANIVSSFQSPMPPPVQPPSSLQNPPSEPPVLPSSFDTIEIIIPEPPSSMQQE